MLSAKENSQKVELYVSHLKSKQHIQVRSGGLCSTRPNRWEEDLLTTNQVPNIAARQDNIPRKSRETVINKWFPESMVIAPSSGTSSGQQNDGSGVTRRAWFDPPHRHFYRHVILQQKHLQTVEERALWKKEEVLASSFALFFFWHSEYHIYTFKKTMGWPKFLSQEYHSVQFEYLSGPEWSVGSFLHGHLVLHTSY